MLPSITSQWMILRWHDFVSFRCFNHFNRHKMTPWHCFPGNKTVFTGLAFPFPLIFPLALKTPPLAEHPPKTLPLPRQEKCSDDKHLNWDEIMMSSISRSYGPWGESFSSTWNSLEGQRHLHLRDNKRINVHVPYFVCTVQAGIEVVFSRILHPKLPCIYKTACKLEDKGLKVQEFWRFQYPVCILHFASLET